MCMLGFWINRTTNHHVLNLNKKTRKPQKMVGKKDLVCKICVRKILKQPISLPCSCTTICKEHVDDATRTETPASITCPACQKSFSIPKEGFKEDFKVKTQLKRDAFLNIEEKRLKKHLEKCLKDLSTMVKSINLAVTVFPVTQYDHFANVRREIDLRRENLIRQINDLSDDLILQVKEAEKEFKLNVENTMDFSTDVDFNLDKEKESLAEFFRSSNLNIESVHRLKRENDAKLSELQAKLDRFKQFELNLQKNKFKVMETFSFEKKPFSFGKLSTNSNVQGPIDKHFENLIAYPFLDNILHVLDIYTGFLVKNIMLGEDYRILCSAMFGENEIITGAKVK